MQFTCTDVSFESPGRKVEKMERSQGITVDRFARVSPHLQRLARALESAITQIIISSADHRFPGILQGTCDEYAPRSLPLPGGLTTDTLFGFTGLQSGNLKIKMSCGESGKFFIKMFRNCPEDKSNESRENVSWEMT